jgi:MFS family permease
LLGLAPAVVISDAFGRKKTIIFGLLGASVASAYFGFASSLVGLVLARALVGFSVAFIPATVVTMLVELSTKETQALHFSLSGMGWSLGALVAPMIGGFFSSLPDTYYLSGLLKQHPYAMPGLVVGAYTTFTAVAGIFLTRETLQKADRRPMFGQLSTSKTGDIAGPGKAPLRGSQLQLPDGSVVLGCRA